GEAAVERRPAPARCSFTVTSSRPLNPARKQRCARVAGSHRRCRGHHSRRPTRSPDLSRNCLFTDRGGPNRCLAYKNRGTAPRETVLRGFTARERSRAELPGPNSAEFGKSVVTTGVVLRLTRSPPSPQVTHMQAQRKVLPSLAALVGMAIALPAVAQMTPISPWMIGARVVNINPDVSSSV